MVLGKSGILWATFIRQTNKRKSENNHLEEIMKKVLKVMLYVIVLLLLSAMFLGAYAWREIGWSPSKEELKSFEKLSYFKDGKFHGPEEMRFYPDKVRNGPAGFSRMLMQSRFAPDKPLPQVKLNKDSFAVVPESFALYWLGHSSVILELGGKRIAFDPVLGNAAPVPFAVPRYNLAPIDYDNLPTVDYVIITHNHYDHLERRSVQALKNSHFIVPLGVGAALRGWGVKNENITELGWGDVFSEDDLIISAETAIHYSGRAKLASNETLWSSYVIKYDDKSIYWGGDSGYGKHFKEIAQKHGSFDLTALEIDAWNPGWPNIHLFPEEAVQAVQDLNAKQILPLHWGVFDLALHPWHESIDMLWNAADNTDIEILTPIMGEKIVPGMTQTQKWWLN